jgi:hypothetical protein
MKIGIIGLGTLGEYYTRDFNRFNTKVIVSKNSTLKSTINKNNLLKKKYKLNILAARNYNDFFNKKIDTVLICSPNDSHLCHLQKSINKKKNVIIEKPIISLKKGSSKKYFIDKLNKILSHNKKIYYNLINEYYAKKYLELFINHKFKNKKFDFIYHTDGTHKKEAIMNDLLPHLFSILDNLLDYNKISNIKKIITLNKNIIQFYADDCFCNIEFIQNSKKKLKFGLDNLIVEREIYEKNGDIRTFLRCKKIKKKIKTNNPLTENIKKIIISAKKYDKNSEYKKITNNFKKCCNIFYA